MSEERKLPKLPESLQDEIKRRTVKTELEAETVSLRAELNHLLVEFKELLGIVKRVSEEEDAAEGIYYFGLDQLEEKDKSKFFEWNEKFETLLTKAVRLKLIEQEFINKHKDFTADDWNKDEFWLEVKDHFHKRDVYSEQIESLNAEIHQLYSSHDGRVGHYKLAALITSCTIAIPLIIGIIYLIDKFLITIPAIKESEEAAISLKQNKAAVQSELERHGSDIKRDFYYQAAKVGTTKTFFGPLKEQLKKQAGNEVKVEDDDDIQKLLETARNANSVYVRANNIKKIHKLYTERTERGRESSIKAEQEEKRYKAYTDVDGGNKEADKEAATDYLDLFSRTDVEPTLSV